ncbi:hypothetical protein ACFUAE_31240, partial [Streptomyces ardesiacus]
MRLEAITWDRLGDRLAERLLDLEPADGSAWTRVALDGAPAARPGDLAERCLLYTGPHLHFEIRTTPSYGSDVDPLAYL